MSEIKELVEFLDVELKGCQDYLDDELTANDEPAINEHMTGRLAILTKIKGIVEKSECTCYMEQDGNCDIVVCAVCEKEALRYEKSLL